MPLASNSATADRTTSRIAGDSRLGGNEIGGVLPVSKRAFRRLVADNGLVLSLNRSRNSCSRSRSSESFSGVRQLLEEGSRGMKYPSSVIRYGFTLSAAGTGVLSGSGDTGLGLGGRTYLSGVRARSAQCISLFLSLSSNSSPVAVRSDLESPRRSSCCSPTSHGPRVVSAAVDPWALSRGVARDSPAPEADTILMETRR